MIIGLQIADSAIVYHLRDTTKGGGGKGGAPIASTGVEVGAELDVLKGSQMLDEKHIEAPFVFAYRIRACIRDNDAYILGSRPTLPAHGAPKLYKTDDPVSMQKTSLAEDLQFKLSRIDGNEEMIEGQYHVSQSMESNHFMERMIVLQESRPKWLYYTSAVGVLVYALFIHYLIGKVI